MLLFQFYIFIQFLTWNPMNNPWASFSPHVLTSLVHNSPFNSKPVRLLPATVLPKTSILNMFLAFMPEKKLLLQQWKKKTRKTSLPNTTTLDQSHLQFYEYANKLPNLREREMSVLDYRHKTALRLPWPCSFFSHSVLTFWYVSHEVSINNGSFTLNEQSISARFVEHIVRYF